MTPTAAPFEIPDATSHRYIAFGVRLASELPCPEIIRGGDDQTPDAVVRFGEVPERLADPAAAGLRYQVGPGEMLLTVDGIARYWVRGGREIVIDPDDDADLDSIRVFLLGSAMGALLQQRGLLVLHASAIETPLGAVAFMGRSGAGKSALAAAMCARGYRVLTDDLCAVEIDDGGPRILPGFPRVRLWADTLKKLSEPSDNLRRVRPSIEKYSWPLAEAFCTESQPLKCLYALETTNEGCLSLETVRQIDAMAVVRDNVYRGQFVNGHGLDGAYFRHCATIARGVELKTARRPQKGLPPLALAARLEEDFGR